MRFFTTTFGAVFNLRVRTLIYSSSICTGPHPHMIQDRLSTAYTKITPLKLRNYASALTTLLLIATSSIHAFAGRSPQGGHFIYGGVGGIVRAHYSTTATAQAYSGGIIPIPKSHQIFIVPFTVTDYAESPDFTLQPDGSILINSTGLYRISESIDWPAQNGTDIDLRHFGIGRLRMDQTLPNRTLGGLIDLSGFAYDQLATYEVPGSDAPAHSRKILPNYTFGTMPPGSTAWIDIPMTPTGVIVPGDVASAGDSALTDANLGAADNSALTIDAKVVAPDVVRVTLHNLSHDTLIVPPGTVSVLASSVTYQRGNSADAWTVIQTPATLLYAGEHIFGNWMSNTYGDFLQVTNQTYLQIEFIAHN